MIINFTVPGIARTGQNIQANFRTGGYFRKLSNSQATWRDRVHAASMMASDELDGELWDEPVGLILIIHRQRPKSAKKFKVIRDTLGKVIQLVSFWADKRPDLDNMEKLFIDAMEGLLFIDDARIVFKTTTKILSDDPRVEVWVGPVMEALQIDVSASVLAPVTSEEPIPASGQAELFSP